MKLSEALILRADAQKQTAQLRQRLIRSAKVQEGEQPPENPQQLIAELEATLEELVALIKQINRTNSLTEFQARTLSNVLAERDTLLLKHNAYSNLIRQRFGRSAIAVRKFGLSAQWILLLFKDKSMISLECIVS